jgi:iron complex transport system substrate-binding protein
MTPRYFSICLALFLLAGQGCSKPEPPGRSLSDDTGRTIRIPDRIDRIVSIAPSATEILFAAGAGSLVVGVTDVDDYPPEIADRDRIQALPLNHESVVALRPDLVVASDQVNDPRDAVALAEMGIPTYFISIQSLPDVSRSVRAMGWLLDTQTSASAFADSLEQQLSALDARRGDNPDPPTVIFLIGDDTLFSFGPESYVHDMIQVAGGVSLTETMDTEAPILSEEFVLDAAPEVLLVAFDSGAQGLLSKHPNWASLPAIADGRVFWIPPDLVLRPGPRLIAGTWAMSDALHGAR